MKTRTFLAWIAEVAVWEAKATAIPAAAAVPPPIRPENGPLFNPSPDEIRATIQEIQAGWTERERLSRVVGRSGPKAWKVPWVHTSAVADPDP